MPTGKKPLHPYLTTNAEEDLSYWKSSGNQKILDRIYKLIEVSLLTPETGIGKPKKLKFQDTDVYSRRINQQHRLVYRIEEERLNILAARFHYDDK